MTWGGGKPHAVGDRGQRYQVTYLPKGEAERKTFGWSSNLEGAERMCQSIDLHPSMAEPMIYDRDDKKLAERP